VVQSRARTSPIWGEQDDAVARNLGLFSKAVKLTTWMPFTALGVISSIDVAIAELYTGGSR
jgi:hypothetical protein